MISFTATPMMLNLQLKQLLNRYGFRINQAGNSIPSGLLAGWEVTFNAPAHSAVFTAPGSDDASRFDTYLTHQNIPHSWENNSAVVGIRGEAHIEAAFEVHKTMITAPRIVNHPVRTY